MPLIALLTDFGTRDGYVAAMKAVIKTICPQASIIDISHDIAPQQVAEARFVLWSTYRYFPVGTVFVCVVDPGVGTERKIFAVKTGQQIFLVPDNGLLDMVLAETEIEAAYTVANPHLFLPQISSTFHGRDIFSPVAAHLLNETPLAEIGPAVSLKQPAPFIRPILRKGSHEGTVIYIDRFGNLVTSFRMNIMPEAAIVIGEAQLPLKKTYADVKVGEALALTGSHGLIEIAVRNGNAQKMFDAGYETKIELVIK